MTLEWTTTKPTKTGYYWWRGHYKGSGVKSGEPQLVWINKYGTLWRFSDTRSRALDDVDGKWAGPIDPPREAREEAR